MDLLAAEITACMGPNTLICPVVAADCSSFCRDKVCKIAFSRAESSADEIEDHSTCIARLVRGCHGRARAVCRRRSSRRDATEFH